MNRLLSFSTLACPSWDIDKIISAACENGYAAIDFRGYLGTTDITDNDQFKGSSLKEIATRIADAGLKVSCLSSSAKMSTANEASLENSLDMIRRYAELCHALGSRQIRIFGGATKGIADPIANAAETLRKAAGIGRDAEVAIAVETHDDWTSSAKLVQAFEMADWPDGVGFVWDVHHPYRNHDEDPASTAKLLSRCLFNTHWKDSTAPNGDLKLCLPGEGDIPLMKCLDALDGIGYDGWYTLEWEKKWHPEIEDPEIAIPAFSAYMRRASR